tara:strand:- start:2 stop:1015 length:1014 start_codon:yes stop_codon:yes gene_type:complete
MSNPIVKNKEVNFFALCDFIKKNLRKLVVFSLSLTLIYNIYFFSKEHQYTSKISFYTNYGDETPVSLLGSLANTYFGNDTSLNFSLRNFLASDLFLEGVVKQEYIFENKKTTLVELWGSKYNNFFNLNPLVTIKNINTRLMFNPNLSVEQKKLYNAKEYLRERINILEDADSSLFTLSIKIKADPSLAEQITKDVYDSIIEYSNYIVKSKAEEKTKFINDRIIATKRELERAEDLLLIFLEKNQNLNSPSLVLQKNRLERDVNVFAQTFNTLSDQLELSKIEEKNTTSPIYILDSQKVAYLKSGMNILQGNIIVFLISFTLKAFHLVYRKRNILIID